MINIIDQNLLFSDIAKKLPKKINVYAIGGTTMMFLGLKQTTLDIDLVFNNDKERKMFKEAVKSLGYYNIDATEIYGKKENTPDMVTAGEVRMDLFLFKIITSYFSDSMQKRAVKIHEFGENLIIKIADVHDILIMKAATTREKDEEDIISIIKNSTINWKLIIQEVKSQILLGNERANLDLGCVLERIKNQGNSPWNL